MSEWRNVTLKDVITIKHGFAFKGEFFSETMPGPILVTPGNFAIGGGFKGNRKKYFTGDVPGEYVLSAGDLVVTMTDLSKAGDTLGYSAMIPSDATYLHNQRIGLVQIDNPSILDKSFLNYMLRTPSYRSYILATSSGSTVRHTSPSRICEYSTRIPELCVQKAIANVLGALDDKIVVNDRIAATYEEIVCLRFADLAIDVDPSPGEEITASDLIAFNPRYRTTSRDDAVYVDMAALSTRTARVIQWARRPSKSGTRFSNGDTVMARITPCLENGKTAYIDFLEPNEIGIGSTEFIVMRARDDIPSHVSYCLARSPRFREHAIRNMVGSSGRQRVAAASLMEFPLSRPRQPELAKFGEFTSKSFEHMKSLDAETQRLMQLRDVLLPKLMSGQIRVRDAEKVVEEAV
ncbi:restriction endonuclease subunit S [Actinomadura rayongensis]|uniref:Restriction endonuclease subunit S n=1 Tax=Actinomadura rayongensis TaxID=1429076 RepID=A0A6I4W892_9ACTN|nr:restriction endonuclease subunit S [Actinomadura rayongensis]MXQ65691.1 restriction endonuclease subunit S [Actinomadura rayongensis]